MRIDMYLVIAVVFSCLALFVRFQLPQDIKYKFQIAGTLSPSNSCHATGSLRGKVRHESGFRAWTPLAGKDTVPGI